MARYNWCQGTVPGRGPAVEKHWLMGRDLYILADICRPFGKPCLLHLPSKMICPEDRGSTFLQNAYKFLPAYTVPQSHKNILFFYNNEWYNYGLYMLLPCYSNRCAPRWQRNCDLPYGVTGLGKGRRWSGLVRVVPPAPHTFLQL